MRSAFLLVSLCVALALSACATSGIEGRGSTQERPASGESLYTRLVLSNTSLAGDVSLVDQKAVFVGDLLKASVTIQSKVGNTLNLQYRFTWLDGNGMEINPESGTWKPLILYGKDNKTLLGVAPNPSAKEFKVVVREQ